MIDTQKDLERLLKLLRKQGVTDFKHNGLELKLGDLPEAEATKHQTDQGELIEDDWAEFPAGMLTPEQLTYYSAGGTPDNDPVLKKDKQ